MWLLSIVVGFISAFFLYLLKIKRKYSSIAHFPGPKGLFLLGNALDIGANPVEIMTNVQRFTEKYGKYIQLWIGINYPILWISDIKFIEYFMNSTRQIEKPKHYHRFIRKWVGESILLADGKKWEKNRKLIAPIFNFKVLELFVECFNNYGTILIEKLSKTIEKDSVDIEPFITSCVFHLNNEIMLGEKDINSEYIETIKNSPNIIIDRVFSSWKRFDMLYRFSKSYNLQQQSIKITHDYPKKIIAQAKIKLIKEKQNKREKELEGTKRTSILDLLLRKTDEEEKLSDDQIKNEINTFMFVGSCSVSPAIYFALYEIAKYPKIQQKLVDEINSVLGNDKMKQPTYQELKSLKYMEMVVKEVLRLYPSVPLFSRKITEDLVFDGVIFPADLVVAFNILMLQRDPEIYEDPEKFIPERFLPEQIKMRNPYSFLPFSAGLRSCIAEEFAMIEIKAILCKVLHNFEISSVLGYKPILSVGIILTSTNGVYVQLKKRNSGETENSLLHVM